MQNHFKVLTLGHLFAKIANRESFHYGSCTLYPILTLLAFIGREYLLDCFRAASHKLLPSTYLWHFGFPETL